MVLAIYKSIQICACLPAYVYGIIHRIYRNITNHTNNICLLMGFCAASNQIRVFRACVQRNCEKEEQTLGTILYARCVCSHKTNNRTKSKNCAIVWWFSAFVLLLLFFSTLCTQCAYNVDNSIRQSNSQCDSLYAVFVLMWALFLRSTFCESTTKSKNANATKYILNLKLRNPVQCNWKRMQYVMAIKFIWWMVFCTLKLTRLLTKKKNK